MKTKDCTSYKSITEKEVYAVFIDAMAVPAAWFSCVHCAKEWGSHSASFGYKIGRLMNAELVGDLLDKISDIEIIHDSYNTPATGALHKHEDKIGL